MTTAGDARHGRDKRQMHLFSVPLYFCIFRSFCIFGFFHNIGDELRRSLNVASAFIFRSNLFLTDAACAGLDCLPVGAGAFELLLDFDPRVYPPLAGGRPGEIRRTTL